MSEPGERTPSTNFGGYPVYQDLTQRRAEPFKSDSKVYDDVKEIPSVEILHRVSIDGKDVPYWRGRGLEMRPIRSAFYDDGVAKAWVFDISESAELWPEVKGYIRGMDFVNTFFTDEERLAADWCILRGVGPIRPMEPVGGNWSRDYYKGICSVCGSGWTQVEPFQLAMEPKVGRNAFASFCGAAYGLFAIDDVFYTFESEGIRGVDSWLILVGKDRHPGARVRQLLVKNAAAPALAEELAEHERFRSSGCSACGPKSYLFYTRGMLPLRRSALRSDVDFQMTNEWFGSGKAARHEILVSRRVAEIILRKKWRGADLSPVQTV